jgi:Tol biopolymer transport system component
MKTTNRIINTLLGAVLSLLVTFGLTHSAAAQTRIALSAPVKTGQTTYQIFSVNPDGSVPTQLTRYGGAFPAWTQDQRKIAFYRDGTIYVMDAAKGEMKGGRIFAAVQASGSGHDWFRGDAAIIYTGRDVIGNGLWLITVDLTAGTVGTPTLIRTGACYAPKSSPDGRKIAFYTDGRVTVLDLDTQTEITFPRDSSSPSWSPGGNLLALSAVVCNGSWPDCHYEIVIANSDGTGWPDATGWTPITRLSSFSYFPVWSPDGAQIAFSSDVSGSKSLYKTTIATGTVTLLYKDGQPGADWDP